MGNKIRQPLHHQPPAYLVGHHGVAQPGGLLAHPAPAVAGKLVALNRGLAVRTELKSGL